MIPLLIISSDPELIQNYLAKMKEGALFYEISRSTSEYSIDDIKNIIKETKIYQPKTRIYYLPDFHLSSLPAQNSFLKLLEEPPNQVQFILTTDKRNRLLPTILSRVKIVQIKEGKARIADREVTELLSLLVDGKNLGLLNNKKFAQIKKDSAGEILLEIIMFFSKRLEEDKKSPKIIKEALRLKRLIESNNLNPQLTVDQILIFIWKTYKMK